VSKVRAERRAGLSHGDVIAAASALLLLILMFATEWYAVAGIPGTSAHAEAVTTENAWAALSVLRWLMLLTVVVAAGGVLIHGRDASRSAVALTRLAVVGLGSLTALLLTYRVLIDLPGPSQVVDQKLGAVLGVIGAYGIALGGYEAIRAQRARSRSLIQTSKSADAVVSGAGPR
jgi:hypothetical protein